MKFGKVYAMCIQGIAISEFDYNYRIGNKVITDPYAKMINGTKIFGEMIIKLRLQQYIMINLTGMVM